MNLPALGLALGGFVASNLSWGLYAATIGPAKVPVRPTAHLLAQSVSVVAALAGLGLWLTGGRGAEGWLLVPAAALALLPAAMFLFLYSLRKTPIGDLRVSVGDPLIPFTSTRWDGLPFASSELAGQRTLLKFFRGGW